MPKILLKRVPKKTDKSNQQKAMRVWSATIVETYSKDQTIPVIDVGKHKSSNGSYAIHLDRKK